MKFALLASLTLVLATRASAQPAVQNTAPVRLGILSEQGSANLAADVITAELSTHDTINPTGIVPVGPDTSGWAAPHGRG